MNCILTRRFTGLLGRSSFTSIEIDLGKQESICFIDLEWQKGQKPIPFKLSASFFSDTGFKEIFQPKVSKPQRVLTGFTFKILKPDF